MEDEPKGPSLWIDYREKALLTAFPNAEERNLELGDIQLAYGNNAQIIIERKTIADLAQSVKDNRYREQKARLLAYRELHPHVKLVYILEGFYHFDNEFRCKNMGNNVLSSCIINSMFRDGIFVMLAKNVQDTINFIQCTKDKFFSNPDEYCLKGYHQGQACDDSVGYAGIAASGIKSRKKDNIDEQTCFLMQLSCVPGISSKKATDIQDYLQVYSIHALIENIKQNGGTQALEAVPGIGKVLSATIVKYLLPSE